MIHTRVGRVGGLGCVLQWRGPSRWKRVQCSGRGTGDGRMGSGSRKTGHGETGSHNTGHGGTSPHNTGDGERARIGRVMGNGLA